jgi:hypothetical protein
VTEVVKKFAKHSAVSLKIALQTDIIPPHQHEVQEPLLQKFDFTRLFSQKNNGTVCRVVPPLQRVIFGPMRPSSAHTFGGLSHRQRSVP